MVEKKEKLLTLQSLLLSLKLRLLSAFYLYSFAVISINKSVHVCTFT